MSINKVTENDSWGLHNITDQRLCFFRQPRKLLETYTTLLTKDSVSSGNQESCWRLTQHYWPRTLFLQATMKAVRDLHNITDQGLCFFRQPRKLFETYTTLLTKDSVSSGNHESCQRLTQHYWPRTLFPQATKKAVGDLHNITDQWLCFFRQ
jgi:hypothetical protein